MTIRHKLERREHAFLCDWATFADQSAGRLSPISPCDNRTCFQRDRDRILHSKAFRRLANKTQVFISPEGDHYRTRLTHTLEVTQIARTIARALDLNEDLAEAVALGHDLGHTPLGHAGERALAQCCPTGFRHNEQSLRMVDCIEPLNLTLEVRDGICCHTGAKRADTPEGQIIHFADRIAYVNHDIDDALRAGLLSQHDIPQHLLEILGQTHSQRIDTMVLAMVTYSQRNRKIGMESAVHDAMMELRTFMFDRVYHGRASSENDRVDGMLGALYQYYDAHFENLPLEYRLLHERGGDAKSRVVCDYIASMTDRFSIATYKRLFIPSTWELPEIR